LAFRTLTEQFKGKVTPQGAWYYGDGTQQAALFKSESGPVLVFWTQGGKKKIELNKNLSAAIAGKKIIDWQGQEVKQSDLQPRHVYIVRAPLVNTLKKGNVLTQISPRPLAPELSQKYQGVVCKADKPIFHELDRYISRSKAPKAKEFNARFAVSATPAKMNLIVVVKDKKHCPDVKGMSVWNGDSVQFAIDVEGKGFQEDCVEFAIGKGNLIFKSMMPAIKGDIPAKFSQANVPLTESKVVTTRSGDTTTYKITVADSDLYPFIYQKGKPIRFSILVNNNNGSGREGYLEWGSGIGDVKAAHLYGTLTPAGYGEKIAGQNVLKNRFMGGKITPGNPVTVSADKAPQVAGVSTGSLQVTPGTRYKFTAQVKGSGNLEIMAYGSQIKRHNFMRKKLSNNWQDVSGEITMPANNAKINFVFFTWKQPDARFEVKNFEVKTFL